MFYNGTAHRIAAQASRNLGLVAEMFAQYASNVITMPRAEAALQTVALMQRLLSATDGRPSLRLDPPGICTSSACTAYVNTSGRRHRSTRARAAHAVLAADIRAGHSESSAAARTVLRARNALLTRHDTR